jgi:hypothetical protein
MLNTALKTLMGSNFSENLLNVIWNSILMQFAEQGVAYQNEKIRLIPCKSLEGAGKVWYFSDWKLMESNLKVILLKK